MKTKFLLKTIHLWILVIIVLLSACQKETSELPSLGLVPTQDTTTTMVSSEEGTIDTTGSPVLMPRAGLNVDKIIDSTGYKYHFQNWIPVGWKKSTSYTNTGKCGYPVYIGSKTLTTASTNLCGIMSFLIALTHVVHDGTVAMPYTNIEKGIRVVRCAKRYQEFDPSYTLGGYTTLQKIGQMANGTSALKGEFSHWKYCDEKIWTASQFSYQSDNSAGRDSTKAFIRKHILLDRPVVALISINTSKKNADETGYISTSGGTGHMVTIVGLKENDATGEYKVYFRDPLANNSKLFSANYTTFLNSMVDFPAGYNALAIWGQ
jgi:hypothetical protein